jgi:hypothetical protein
MNFGNLNVVRKQICRKLTHDVYDEYTQAGLYSNDDYEDVIHSQIEELQQRLINLQCFNEMKTILYELKRNSDKINEDYEEATKEEEQKDFPFDHIECCKQMEHYDTKMFTYIEMNSTRDLIMKRHIHIMNQQLNEFDNTITIEDLNKQTINEEELKRLFEKNNQDYLEYNRQYDLENQPKKSKKN